MILDERFWPDAVWKGRWSLPRYRNGALWIAGIALGAAALGAAVGEVGRFGSPAQHWIVRHCVAYGGLLGLAPGLTTSAGDLLWILVKTGLVITVVSASPVFLVWWERKISAHMQSRFGPMVCGGFHGWLQCVADGVKLLLKENITPDAADPWTHRLAPAVAVVPALLAFAPVSFGRELSAADLDVGTLYVFALAGVSVLGLMMAGWGSGNKYSLLGGLRSTAQMVSYELPRSFSVVPVLMFAGTLDLTGIVEAQADWWTLPLTGIAFLPRWFVFYPVVGQLAFAIFLIASVAETNRVPFDLPEAESELVSGFHTEYSGIKFSLFFMAEYAYVLLASCLAAAFFLGGGGAPLPWLTFLPSWWWFLAKVLVMVFLFMWFRWTFPRLRVDRLMDLNWKFLLPWCFANIAFAGLALMF